MFKTNPASSTRGLIHSVIVSIEGAFIYNQWIKVVMTCNVLADISLNQNNQLIDGLQLGN